MRMVPVILSVLLAAAPYLALGEPPASCSRVVSLSPNLTELVYALGLGDRLVGRSSACDFPAEAKTVPVVGDFGRPNWEALQALNPDLVIATSVEKPALLKRLESVGIRHLLLPCEGWGQLLDAARTVSQAVGAPDAGERWVRDMDARRDALEARTKAWLASRSRIRVYTEVWGDPITTVGGNSFLGDIVTLAGGENIATRFKMPYVHVSSEWVIGENPEVILRAYMLPGVSTLADVGKRPGWGAIRAVQTGAICTNIPPDWLLRPGPRLLDGAEAFADWLQARFKHAGE
ncbi:MAG: hypothetical protein BWK77_09300 [Verrucomicrobia bacterium A1]|nr:MAG: hypothetical protein BWK77_09300 [Verrucomicrobia bacterium A1]